MVAESGDSGGSRVPPPTGVGGGGSHSSGGTRGPQPLPSSMAATSSKAECDWAKSPSCSVAGSGASHSKPGSPG